MATYYWIGGTGTWNAANTANWSLSSGGTTAGVAPTTGDNIVIDGHASGLNGGTITTDADIAGIAFGSLTCGTMNGTLTINNHNTSFASVSTSGAGTRTINFGSGTMRLTGLTGAIWDNGTRTAQTFNEDTSTISIEASSTPTGTRTFSAGATETYYNIAVINSAHNGQVINFTPTGAIWTMNNFTLSNVGRVQFPGGTITVNGDFTIAGTSSSPMLLHAPGGTNTTFALGAGNDQSISWAALNQITATGSTITATNSFDLGANGANVTITPPQVNFSRVIGG